MGRHIRVVVGIIGALTCLLAFGCKGTSTASSPREKELQGILKRIQKPGMFTEDSEKLPGYCNPTNKQDLKVFISKYPKTEEAFLAEVWLIYAQGNSEGTPVSAEQRRTAAARAEALQRIISKTTRPGLKKMAKLQRVTDLFGAEDYGAFEKEANDVLAQIKEYETERDDQFLILQCLAGQNPSEIGASILWLMIIVECDQEHWDKAMAKADELQRRFPSWSKRHNVPAIADMLKRGNNPYPKFR